MSIFFFNEDVAVSLRNKRLIAAWLTQVSESEGYSISNLNIILTSDERLYNMNVEFLKHDYLTDVITFDYGDGEQNLSGEIFISIDRVRENALELEKKWQDEFYRVLVHGLLHLMGYKDKKRADQAIMRAKEDFYLNLLAEFNVPRETK